MRRPFTLYKESTKTGIVWYARFWDETAQKYKHSRSTGVFVEGKKERRYEAEQEAKKIYDELCLTLLKPVEISPQTNQEPQSSEQQLPPTIAVKQSSVADTPLIEYCFNFWTADSEYAQFKRNVKNKPLTPLYLSMNHSDIRRHVETYSGFHGITVGSLTKAILKKWLIWLSSRRKTRTRKDGTIKDEGVISGRTANSVILAVRVAVRWAVDNEEIPIDPFYKLGEINESLREKGILTFEERKLLTELPITDKNYKQRLAMLLGSFCGLRRGEMRGLQWGDISDGIMHIQHAFMDGEGLKLPKYNSVRKVPIPSYVQKILDFAYTQSNNPSPENYILESPKYKGKPVSNNFFRDRVKIELSSIGITEEQQKERFITCHSLRHTFVTLAQLSGIPEIEVQALVGHKSIYMTKKYTHVPQVINFDEARRKLEIQSIANMPKAANF